MAHNKKGGNINRRKLLYLLSGGATFSVLGKTCLTTPYQTEGPFYPEPLKRIKTNILLNKNPEKETVKLPELLFLTGKVVDQKCKPIKGVKVEIWQADFKGQYKHPLDPSKNLIPNFLYFGSDLTNEKGEFWFWTIKPAAYGNFFFRRTPHIHFKVKSSQITLTTQLYFSGEKLNSSDGILNSLGKDKEKVIIDLEKKKNSFNEYLEGHFDISLT